jgi:hypothetical protein
MALTYTFVADSVQGNFFSRVYNIKLDTAYPTGGYVITPGKVKLGIILGIQPLAANGIASTIIWPWWDYVAGKLMCTVGGTPGGTISGNVTVVGGGIGEAIGINPDTNAGVLSKAAATTRTIPIATFLGAAPTFTGTAAPAPIQVANGFNLSAVTLRIAFIGNK